MSIPPARLALFGLSLRTGAAALVLLPLLALPVLASDSPLIPARPLPTMSSFKLDIEVGPGDFIYIGVPPHRVMVVEVNRTHLMHQLDLRNFQTGDTKVEIFDEDTRRFTTGGVANNAGVFTFTHPVHVARISGAVPKDDGIVVGLDLSRSGQTLSDAAASDTPDVLVFTEQDKLPWLSGQ